MAFVRLDIHNKLGTPPDVLEHAQENDADDQNTSRMNHRIPLAAVKQGTEWRSFPVWSSHQGFCHHPVACQQISVAVRLGAHQSGHEQVS